MRHSTAIPTRRAFISSAAVLLAAPAILRVRSARAAPEPIVAEIANGKLRGMRDNGAISFKGVPYAADTGGANRFMAPRPVANWTGVRDAVQFGDRCPQSEGKIPGVLSWYPAREAGFSENCCVLNLWTPDLDANARRPVMFYIHGGGFTTGAGQGDGIEGTNLAKFGNAVVITINHRLNIFGYCNLAYLDSEFADAGNTGQLDLIAALNWVKINVGAFGGDAGNVTVFGQSGGGSKISTLMAMPAAKGLFHRAINMSGSSAFQLPRAADTERQTNELIKTLGVDKSNLRKLQQLPADQVVAAYGASLKTLKSDSSRPIIDGRHIMFGPLTPEGLALHASVPLMYGTTATEATPFMGGGDMRNFNVTEQQVKARIKGQYELDDAKVEAVMAAYRKDVPERSATDVLMTVASDALVRVPVLRAADTISSSQHAPLFAYNFAWKVPVEKGIWGTPHTADIPFAFGNIDKARSMTGEGPQPEEIQHAMMAAFVAFARTGNPNNPIMPEWKPYDATNRATMVVDTKPMLVNDFHGNDRRTSMELGNQSTFQLFSGPLFRYSEQG